MTTAASDDAYDARASLPAYDERVVLHWRLRLEFDYEPKDRSARPLAP
jgi:hypothetical protein